MQGATEETVDNERHRDCAWRSSKAQARDSSGDSLQSPTSTTLKLYEDARRHQKRRSLTKNPGPQRPLDQHCLHQAGVGFSLSVRPDSLCLNPSIIPVTLNTMHLLFRRRCSSTALHSKYSRPFSTSRFELSLRATMHRSFGDCYSTKQC